MEGSPMDLDNAQVIKQRDPQDALGVAAAEWPQLREQTTTIGEWHDHTITKLVVAGMGGSALAAGLAKEWLDLHIPFEVCKSYQLPKYIDSQTLVIASSYSGNTEETVAGLAEAQAKGAQVAVIAAGGHLIEQAESQGLLHVRLSPGLQPRMAVFSNLVALIRILEKTGVVSDVTRELVAAADAMESTADAWDPQEPEVHNQAKQLAQQLVGKTPVVYASSLMRSVAYKWKISFNENAKNVAFWNELPEFNHNEFMGWVSHPVQKPFGVIDLRSSFDHPQIKKRFEISDRLLSGKRPKAIVVTLQGDSILEQMLWGCVLADYVSIYLAILNGIDPTPVELIEKLKKEL